MKRTRYEAFSNQAEGFFMKDGEDHQDMYRRLKAIATTFKNLGAHHIDDDVGVQSRKTKISYKPIAHDLFYTVVR
jgi:hypothetical protein